MLRHETRTESSFIGYECKKEGNEKLQLLILIN